MSSRTQQQRQTRSNRRGRTRSSIGKMHVKPGQKTGVLFVRSPVAMLKPLKVTESPITLSSSALHGTKALATQRHGSGVRASRSTVRPLLIRKSGNSSSINNQSAVQFQTSYAVAQTDFCCRMSGTPYWKTEVGTYHEPFVDKYTYRATNTLYHEVDDTQMVDYGSRIHGPRQIWIPTMVVPNQYNPVSMNGNFLYPSQGQYLPEVCWKRINVHPSQVQPFFYPQINQEYFNQEQWSVNPKPNDFIRSAQVSNISPSGTCLTMADGYWMRQAEAREYQTAMPERHKISANSKQSDAPRLTQPVQKHEGKVTKHGSELAELISTAMITTALGHGSFFDDQVPFGIALDSVRKELADVISSTVQDNAAVIHVVDAHQGSSTAEVAGIRGLYHRTLEGHVDAFRAPYHNRPEVEMGMFQAPYHTMSEVELNGFRAARRGMSKVEEEGVNTAHRNSANIDPESGPVSFSDMLKAQVEAETTEEDISASSESCADVRSKKARGYRRKPVVWLGLDSSRDLKKETASHADQCVRDVDGNESESLVERTVNYIMGLDNQLTTFVDP